MYANANNLNAMMLRRRASAAPDPILALFASGEQGVYSYPTNAKASDGDFINFTDEGGTIPADADDVVRFIRDLSGNDHHLKQSDISKGFALRTGGGLWWWESDGVDDIMITDDDFLYVAGSATITVAARGDAQLDKRIISEATSSNPGPIYAPVQTDSTIGDEVASFIRGAVGQEGQGLAFDDANRVISVIDSGSQLTYRVDGLQTGTQSYTRSDQAVTRLALGGLPGPTPSAFFAGRIFGVVAVADEIGTSTQEAWAAEKAGVTL